MVVVRMTPRAWASPRVEQQLTRTPWLALALGALTAVLLPGTASDVPTRVTLVVTLLIFFGALVARLVVVALRQPARRVALSFLAGAVALWAVGSATVSAGQTLTAVPFPAPGEILCFASYVGMAAFLLVEVPGTSVARQPVVWVEAAIVCGAAVCLAAFPLLVPLSGTFTSGGLALLLAVLYPLINLVMFGAVLGQMIVGRRARTPAQGALLAGFLGLAIADSTFLVGHSVGTYSANLALDALWGVSFALIVHGACARPGSVSRPEAPERQRSSPLAAAAGLAVVVLGFGPPGAIGWAVKAPAIITLVCTGVRLVIALRDARGAAEALRLSLTDELTGLPNRRALLAAVGKGLSSPGPVAVILLDLDGFKDVNDGLGHTVGDEVLIALAHRMRHGLSHGAFLARLGGDEFALVVATCDELVLVEVAQGLRTVLREPITMQGLDLRIEASVGITVRADGSTAGELLRQADVAMYQAKQVGAGVVIFARSLDGDARHRLAMGEALRHALARDELVVWYQPQVDARTREVVAVEALVRWQHPTDGLLPPIRFLADARGAGLMPALTEVVLARVLHDARRWADAGVHIRVAMNWAAPELVDDRLVATLIEGLDRSGVSPDRLIIEVTEDCFLADPQRARSTILGLREYGLQVSIDDYGTGFSSLSYLRDLPIQEIKLDRSFITPVAWDAKSRMIVQSTAQMARAFGLRLVAEGVEDGPAAAELVPMGVDVLQGFFIAKPMPGDEVEAWIEDWRLVRAPGVGAEIARPVA